MMNKIWGVFIIIGILFSLFTGNIESLNNEIINSPGEILNIFLSMFPLMVVWSGLMNIAKDAGLLDKLSHLMTPLFNIIFPDLASEESLTGIKLNTSNLGIFRV